MNEVIEELKLIADMLYKNETTASYAKLASVIPLLSQSIGNVEDESIRNLLVEKLGIALSAMEKNDGLLLADTISGGLVDVLNKI